VREPSEVTLVGAPGFPDSSRRATIGMLGASRVAVVVGAMVVAGLAVGMTLIGTPTLGVGGDNLGGVVSYVLPGGQAWRDGIRVGQRVDALEIDGELGWHLDTSSGGRSFHTYAEHLRSELRDTLPVASAAVLLALAALALLRSRPSLGLALAALAAFIGADAALVDGTPVVTTVAASLGMVTVAGALAVSGAGRMRLAVASGLGGIAVAWTVTRFVAPVAFDAADAARRVSTLSVGGFLLVSALSGDVRHWAPGWPRISRFDLAFSAALVATVLLLWRELYVAPPVVAGIAALAVAGYAVVRGTAARLVDRLVIAETRERSRIQAIEEERGRLARELHDDPLQRLAGVIKDLERDGTSPGETAVLMGIADGLRGFATDLRPPVLDDLGLVPALTSLAADGPPPVTVELDDATGYDAGSRLPSEVELAFYRIAAEATRNAAAHSGGTQIRITGTVAPDRASIAISDDGHGLDPDEVRARQLAGHLGLSTMRQRATLVGASLAVDSSPVGVTVRVDWRRP